jgi:hypothetical protein
MECGNMVVVGWRMVGEEVARESDTIDRKYMLEARVLMSGER